MGMLRIRILDMKSNRTLEGATRIGLAGVRLDGVIDNPRAETLQDYGWSQNKIRAMTPKQRHERKHNGKKQTNDID